MAVELATAYVSLTASAKGIGQSIANELGGELQGASKQAGDDAGAAASQGFLGKFGAGLGGLKTVGIAAAGLFAAGFASVIGAGVLLEGIGSDFDDAFDTLRVSTGKTGDELAGLEQSFRDVFTTAPVSMGDTSTAIAEVNRRLGLAGQPLEDLSTQFLNLSRITDTDLGTNIESVAGLFNQFGIKGEQAGTRLDELFRISQQTGVSVADLASQMVDSGTAFREVGLDFSESASLLGLLAKNGLSVSDVLPAVNKSLATAAKDGRGAEEVFRETFDAIRNAPDDVTAAAAALETFGSKAGPKFAALIRDGKLSYEDFARTIADSPETIDGAAAATDDWREKLTLLKNKALVALEPVASRVFNGITTLVEDLAPKVQAGIQDIVDGFNGVGDGGNFARIGEITRQVVEVIQREWPKIKEIISNALTTAQQVIAGFVTTVTVIWQNFGPQITAFVTATWNQIKGTIEAALQIIRGIVQTVTSLIRGDWSGVWEGIKQIVAGVWDGIVALATGFIGRVRAVLSALLELLGSIFRRAWEEAKKAVSTGITNVITLVQQLPGKAVAALAAIGSALLGRGQELIKGLIQGAISLEVGYLNFVRGLPGKAISALGSVGSALFSAGADLMRGFINGVKSVAGNIADAVLSPIKSAVNGVKGFLGIGSPSKLFRDIGLDTMKGYAIGLDRGSDRVVHEVMQPASATAAAFSSPAVHAPPAPIVITGNTFVGSGPEVVKLLNQKLAEARQAAVRLAV